MHAPSDSIICVSVCVFVQSYMNSYLQTLFYLPAFRRAVYSLPVEASQLLELLEPSASSSTVVTTKDIPLALQHLFYTLDKSEKACNTLKLTQSFGWTAADSFQQHDVSRPFADAMQPDPFFSADPISLMCTLVRACVCRFKSLVVCFSIIWRA